MRKINLSLMAIIYLFLTSNNLIASDFALQVSQENSPVVYGKATTRDALKGECGGFLDKDAVLEYKDDNFRDIFTEKFSTNIIKKMFIDNKSSVKLWSSNNNLIDSIKKMGRDGLDAVKNFTNDSYKGVIPLCLGESSFDPPSLSDYSKEVPDGLYFWFLKDTYVYRKIDYAWREMDGSYKNRYPDILKDYIYNYCYRNYKDNFEICYRRFKDADLVYNSKNDYVYLVKGNFFKYCQKYGYNILGAPKEDDKLIENGVYKQNFENGRLEFELGGGSSDPSLGITHYDKDNNVVFHGISQANGFTCDKINDGFQARINSWGGQCVPYVRKETGIEYSCCNGYAKNCYDQARTCNYEVGATPKRGAIAVFNSWNGNSYGHVGIVIGIDSKNGRIQLRHSNWHLNERVSEDWVSTKNLKGYIYAQGEGCTGGGGTTPPTDPPASGKLPDFITSKVTMGNKDGNHEKYTWKINETAYVHDYIDNIGTADWEGSADKIKVPFYLSKGSKEDSHSEWVRIGDRQSIKKENLKVKKDPKHEKIEFKLQDYANDGTIMPGRTYNFVVCADRPKDEDNGDGDVKEKHKSNNCSTEAVFYVDYGPPRNVDLLARNLALTGGRSSLQAGEKYGLQVEISNIGTQQPWNGFSSSYEIKGPGTGTGGTWQRIGEDTSRASSLYPNATHFENMSSEQEVAAPMVGGDYVFRACADYTQAVPETDESNNCTAELPVYIAPPPMPDLITEGLQLTHGRTSLIAGELYGLTVAIRNVGDAKPSSDIRTNYEIKGPGTGDAWQFVADDSTDADNLAPGASQWEEITDGHGAHIPAVPGTYTARACADYQGRAQESNESNNCSEMTFEVQPVPAGSPRIVITNPNSDDDWRSDETDHDFRWDYYDFPERGHVRIEYSLDGGATWLLVTDSTDNDGRKYWEDMCDYHTVDTHHAFVRITSVEYPYVYDVSDEFTIDHAKECE